MPKIRSIIVSGNGVNCEYEMAHANFKAGADAVDIVSIYELLAGKKKLEDYQFLNLPGGFMDGDDLGAAKAGATRYQFAKVAGSNEILSDMIKRFIDDGKCIIGVCNGFQLLIKLGLLPALDGEYFTQTATLTGNDHGRFEDRWVRVVCDPDSPCVFTRGLEKMELPIRHGEGKFVPASAQVYESMKRKKLVPMRYADAEGNPTEKYPENPNGSIEGVAGLCDETGRIFGLMPHPEAYTHRTNHPKWTRETLPEKGEGLILFEKAISYLRQA
jgi:phosphoribosylformylglycinamidine synthase subunit PurQ / glutaminase